MTRVITHLQKDGYLPVSQSEMHVHHLVPGIILILLSGYIGISFWRVYVVRWLMAIVFGIGAALTIDEFALWLRLRDVYWQDQGRISIDAVVITVTFLVLVLTISEAHDHQWLRRHKKGFKKSRT